MVNEQKFFQQEFGDKKYISSRSHIKWYSASGVARLDYANMIQMIEMEVQDEKIIQDTQIDDGFTIEKYDTRLMPYENERIMKAVTYEFSYDKHLHIRRVSTVLDRISLIGGL